MSGVTAVLLALLAQSPAASPAPAAPPATARVSIVAGLTWDASQFRFRFENPSSFNTPELVPHDFEQRYRRPHPALWIQARYGSAGRQSTTSVRIGARQVIRASDIDTFVQPDGDIATSGTDGPVRLRAWAVRHTMPLGAAGAWRVAAALTYTRDTGDFLPDDRVVTHTRPPSVTRTFITDNEYTTAQTFRTGLEASRWRAAGAWRHTFALGLDPLVTARLSVRLPQKYPGQNLRYAAFASGAGAGWSVERRVGGVTVGARIDADITWRYRPSSAYGSRSLRVTAFAGR